MSRVAAATVTGAAAWNLRDVGGMEVAEMARAYGSFGAYLEDGLGVDAATLDALRAAFVEPR